MRPRQAARAAAGAPAGAGASLTAEPEARVGGRWIALIALANLGLYLGYLGPISVLLPNQVQAIAGPAHKVAVLGLVTGVGAAVAMVANPVAGALSDRTASRFGRRRPWIAGGALAGAAALMLLAGQHALAGVILGWCLVQACLNALQASLSAAVPDQVPVRQRGTVSGWIGLPQSVGVLLAVVLVTDVVTGNAGYVLLAGCVVVCVLPFALSTPDLRLPRAGRPPWDRRAFARSFWLSPRRYPDFAWAWLTRFAINLGNAMTLLYLLYFLRDRIHYSRLFPGHKAEDGLVVLILLYLAGVVITAVAGGILSDRTGRRKLPVTVAGLVMAGAAALLALSPSWPAAMGAAAIMGLGYGVYLSVDAALVTQVLPAAAGRAKDLGIINIANSGPQVLAPAVAAPLVSQLGGYPSLYLTVAVVTVLGSLSVQRIRSVP
ncbi:MAG TPA: MFS transporter [Streptosporangiaceae bacterium]|nr:MFS transporter [Streptosporangiaceae bacterium]